MSNIESKTVKEVLGWVESDKLLLPSIQRSFVWNEAKICTLFDSLMRRYPIGSLLMWSTVPGAVKELRFHRLHTDYEGSANHGVAFNPPKTKAVRTALDGQQRLTALNIGVRGSLRSQPEAGHRYLFIDLDGPGQNKYDEDHDPVQYEFRFLSPNAIPGTAWFQVSHATGKKSDTVALNSLLEKHGIKPNVARRQTLKRLVEMINLDQAIRFETVPPSKTLDEVLQVFARANMGGTKLTLVDLLISTATGKMTNLDPSTEFPKLRKEIQQIGLDVDKTRIMKASMVLIGIDPKFQVMSPANMKKIEVEWDKIAHSLKVAAKLLVDFGLDDKTLAAKNAIIPVASYVFLRSLNEGYVKDEYWERDRLRVRSFVARSLLKNTYWTGAVDQILVKTHAAIKGASGKTFPSEAIEKALAPGKSLAIDEAWLDELLGLSYSSKTRVKVLLTLLYPEMQKKAPTAIDHVFPRSRFTDTKLAAAGVPPEDRENLRLRGERLANLQLLGDSENSAHKRASMPRVWLQPLSRKARERYSAQHVSLQMLPTDISKAAEYWDKRRIKLRSDIEALLRGPSS